MTPPFQFFPAGSQACCDDSGYVRALEWTHRHTSESHTRHQAVQVEGIMTGELIPSESQDFRHECQQKNSGKILVTFNNCGFCTY